MANTFSIDWATWAGTADERLADLNAAFQDEEIRAVFTTRGGKDAYRIAERVDLNALRCDPKPLVGFSDITNSQLGHLQARRGVGSTWRNLWT
jgi:muramoyltetrapeptide carboxypeptidase